MYNVAGDGQAALERGGRHLRHPPPAPPPVRAPGPSRPRCAGSGSIEFPPEIEGLLRYGRGVDTSRLGQAGFDVPLHQAGAVESFARAIACAAAIGDAPPAYRYEQDVEQFFRHSPAVVAGIDG